jgi:hypothetical protein
VVGTSANLYHLSFGSLQMKNYILNGRLAHQPVVRTRSLDRQDLVYCVEKLQVFSNGKIIGAVTNFSFLHTGGDL